LGRSGLSLLILGMLDNAALAPLAGIAAADTKSWTFVRFFVVAIAGVLAAVVVAFLPQFAATRRVMRYRVGRWLGEHTQSRKEALAALLLISVSWALRVRRSFSSECAGDEGLLPACAWLPLRIGRVCSSADRARGCSDAGRRRRDVLTLSGVPTAEALAFAVAAQALSS